MASAWSFFDIRSHRAQLVISTLSASVATYGALTALAAYSRRRQRRQLDADARRSIQENEPLRSDYDSASDEDITLNSRTQPRPSVREMVLGNNSSYDEELIREQLARNYTFFGEEGMTKIRGAKIVVVGLGGVGSWASIMLVRSGVSKIRLVDFDYVTLSSLNRHATALASDVGTPKAACVARTVRDIAKWVEVEQCVDVWRKEDGGRLLKDADWVVDAIDNIGTKVDLLKYCHDHSIKVFSSMGAGAKCDPTRIQIADISSTIYDPLARSVRRRLRTQGVSSGIPVVYSTEVPGDVRLLPLPEEEFQKGNVKELGVMDDFRVRILPVLGPLPSIFGLNAATYILCELAGQPIQNPLPVKNRRKVYERMLRDFLHREEKITGQTINKLPIDEDDVAFIFEDLHRGRSLVPPHDVPVRPALARWDPAQPVVVENCVIFELGDAERHVRECFGESRRPPGEVWGKEVQAAVDRRVAEVKGRREWVM